MALINRMSRLFTADVHAVLDRIEEPDVLLKQAIREMEEELVRGEQALRLLAHQRERLADRQRKLIAARAEIAGQLDVCFADGNDELARKTLKRRLETERLAQHAVERGEAVEKEITQRQATINEQREHLDVMRQKAELLTTATDDSDEWSVRKFAVTDDEVELAFLRERQLRKPS
jgi:phage shock protein A